MTALTIGELSRRTGCATSAIRFYEAQTLLPLPARTRNGRRTYGAETVAALALIASCRKSGLSLEQIRRLQVDLRLPPGQCKKARTVLQDAVADLGTRIRALQKARLNLSRVATLCNEGDCGPDTGCTIAANMTAR